MSKFVLSFTLLAAACNAVPPIPSVTTPAGVRVVMNGHDVDPVVIDEIALGAADAWRAAFEVAGIECEPTLDVLVVLRDGPYQAPAEWYAEGTLALGHFDPNGEIVVAGVGTLATTLPHELGHWFLYNCGLGYDEDYLQSWSRAYGTPY
jgi:hypothetical protein